MTPPGPTSRSTFDLDVVEVAAVAGLAPDALEPREHQAHVVVPAIGQHRAALRDARRRCGAPSRAARRSRAPARAAPASAALLPAWAHRRRAGRRRPGKRRRPRTAAKGRDGLITGPIGICRVRTARQIDRSARPGQARGNWRRKGALAMSLPDPVRTPTEARRPAIGLGLARRAAQQKRGFQMTKRIRIQSVAGRGGALAFVLQACGGSNTPSNTGTAGTTGSPQGTGGDDRPGGTTGKAGTTGGAARPAAAARASTARPAPA